MCFTKNADAKKLCPDLFAFIHMSTTKGYLYKITASSVTVEHFTNWLELNAQRNRIAPSDKKFSSLTLFSMTHLNQGEVVMHQELIYIFIVMTVQLFHMKQLTNQQKKEFRFL